MDFNIESFVSPPVAVLRLEGELDLHTAPQVPPAVDHALERGCTLIGIDLAGSRGPGARSATNDSEERPLP